MMTTTTRKQDISQNIEKVLQFVCALLIAAAPVCAILSIATVSTIPLV